MKEFLDIKNTLSFQLTFLASLLIVYQMSLAYHLLRTVQFQYATWQVIKVLRQVAQTCSPKTCRI